MELRGGNGGAGRRFSRRGILGDTHGEPLLGDCWRACSDDERTEAANDARLLLANHCDGSCTNTCEQQAVSNEKKITCNRIIRPTVFQHSSFEQQHIFPTTLSDFRSYTKFSSHISATTSSASKFRPHSTSEQVRS